MTKKNIDLFYVIGYSLLLLGTVLIPFSSWLGGGLFFAAIGLICLTAGLSIL